MDIAKATFTNLLANAVLVKDGAVVKRLPCTDNIITLEV
jgi:hypothetical protein